MPTLKYDPLQVENVDDETSISESDLQPIAYDCDNLPYIVTEDFGLLTDHFQRKWMDQVDEHLVFLWEFIKNYTNENNLPILEHAKFVDFIHFVARTSIKFPMESLNL